MAAAAVLSATPLAIAGPTGQRHEWLWQPLLAALARALRGGDSPRAPRLAKRSAAADGREPVRLGSSAKDNAGGDAAKPVAGPAPTPPEVRRPARPVIETTRPPRTHHEEPSSRSEAAVRIPRASTAGAQTGPATTPSREPAVPAGADPRRALPPTAVRAGSIRRSGPATVGRPILRTPGESETGMSAGEVVIRRFMPLHPGDATPRTTIEKLAKALARTDDIQRAIHSAIREVMTQAAV